MEGALVKAARFLIDRAVQPFFDFFKAPVEGIRSCLGGSATYYISERYCVHDLCGINTQALGVSLP